MKKQRQTCVRLALHAFPAPRASDMASLARVTAQQQHDARVLDRWVRRLRARDIAWMKRHWRAIFDCSEPLPAPLGMGPLEPGARITGLGELYPHLGHGPFVVLNTQQQSFDKTDTRFLSEVLAEMHDFKH